MEDAPRKLSEFDLADPNANVTPAIDKTSGEQVFVKRFWLESEPARTAEASQVLNNSLRLDVPVYTPLANDCLPTWRGHPNRGYYAACNNLGTHTLEEFLQQTTPQQLPEASQLIRKAMNLVDQHLVPLATGVDLPQGGTVTYDHDDVGTHNLVVGHDGTLHLIDIEGNHFSIGNKPPSNQELAPTKRTQMLTGIVIDIASNKNFSATQKHTLLDIHREEIETNPRLVLLRNFYLETS